ncbi:hypothetical protein Tco_0936091 [Tanacetum coccineum]
MASQDPRLSKFKVDFKRQQGEMTNKIDIVLKAITDQITGTLPSDTVKNPKLGTHPVSSGHDGEPQNEGPNEGEGETTEEPVVEYFDTFPTRDKLTYHSWIMRRKLDPKENTNGGVSNFTGRIKGMYTS